MEEISNHHFTEIIKGLMWVYGDSEHPLDKCASFLCEIVREQLLTLIKRAWETSKCRGKQLIGYVEILFEFRRHPSLIRRLLRYINNIDEVDSLRINLKSKPNKNEEDEKMDYEKDHLEEEMSIEEQSISTTNFPQESTTTSYNCKIDELLEAIDQIDVLGEIKSVVSDYATFVDDVKIERLKRIVQRIREIDAKEYEAFSLARQTSFCGRSGKRLHKYCEKFLAWLKEPPIEQPGALLILNFCAIEIIAIIVGGAYLVRQSEPRGLFEEDEPKSKSLQLRHYHESLRRNKGYFIRRRRSVLFGYF